MYICTCMYIYVHICTYIYTYIYICIHIYIYVYIHICMYIYLHICTYIYIFTFTYLRLHTYMVCTCACIHKTIWLPSVPPFAPRSQATPQASRGRPAPLRSVSNSAAFRRGMWQCCCSRNVAGCQVRYAGVGTSVNPAMIEESIGIYAEYYL